MTLLRFIHGRGPLTVEQTVSIDPFLCVLSEYNCFSSSVVKVKELVDNLGAFVNGKLSQFSLSKAEQLTKDVPTPFVDAAAGNVDIFVAREAPKEISDAMNPVLPDQLVHSTQSELRCIVWDRRARSLKTGLSSNRIHMVYQAQDSLLDEYRRKPAFSSVLSTFHNGTDSSKA